VEGRVWYLIMFQFERVYRIYLVLLICVLMFAIVGVIKPGFASLLNIGNVLAITAIVAMAGAGQTLCVLAGGRWNRFVSRSGYVAFCGFGIHDYEWGR